MTIKNNHSILFLGKKNDQHCSKALEFVRKNFSTVSAYLGEWGNPLPEEIKDWEGDYIISYLSRWIVPKYLIKKAKVAAINFHPASPDYPGIGCNNFALYEDAEEYGVTCHHMAAKVDTGDLITVKRFPVFPNDDVGSLLMRTYDFQLILFYEVIGQILRNKPLPSSKETWTRKPISRKEFNQLKVITPTMTAEEIEKRIRATSYDVFQPFIEINGHVFQLKPHQKD
jgi:methionyl-tRNA formyltransferase